MTLTHLTTKPATLESLLLFFSAVSSAGEGAIKLFFLNRMGFFKSLSLAHSDCSEPHLRVKWLQLHRHVSDPSLFHAWVSKALSLGRLTNIVCTGVLHGEPNIIHYSSNFQSKHLKLLFVTFVIVKMSVQHFCDNVLWWVSSHIQEKLHFSHFSTFGLTWAQWVMGYYSFVAIGCLVLPAMHCGIPCNQYQCPLRFRRLIAAKPLNSELLCQIANREQLNSSK